VGTSTLASVDIPRGEYTYGYDIYGNVTTITAPDNGVLTYTYDGVLPMSQTWTGDITGKVDYSYNNSFLATQYCINTTLCTAYSYDLDNLAIQVGDLAITRDIQKGGAVTGTSLGNISRANTFSIFGEMLTDTSKFNTTDLYNATYQRDKLGRITERSQTLQGSTETQTYVYNDAGRLASVTQGSKTVSYTYDDNGNRLSKQIVDGA